MQNVVLVFVSVWADSKKMAMLSGFFAVSFAQYVPPQKAAWFEQRAASSALAAPRRRVVRGLPHFSSLLLLLL